MSVTGWAQTGAAQTGRYAQTDALRADNRINELPRYGGLRKTPEQLAADEQFVAVSLAKYGSPQAAMQAHVNFGWHYLATGHAPTAIKRFNQAWLLDSTAADVYYGFSAYLRQQGQLEQAEHYVELGQRHDIDHKGIVRYYGSLAMGKEAKRDYGGAIALYHQIVQQDADNAFANKKLGYWYMEQDTARANVYLSRAVVLDPHDSVSYLNRGWLRYKQKHYDMAVDDYSQAVQINPHYLAAYSNRALAHLAAKDSAAANADWQRGLQLVAPREKGSYYMFMAQSKQEAGDRPGACAAWHEALRWGLEPDQIRQARRSMKAVCP
ncbi:hypothetical protein N008_17595 [Hymenobacter sp. APR13]|nr:hypothetical protein N008_17595 [Hymenobacter sp. APR13]